MNQPKEMENTVKIPITVTHEQLQQLNETWAQFGLEKPTTQIDIIIFVFDGE